MKRYTVRDTSPNTLLQAQPAPAGPDAPRDIEAEADALEPRTTPPTHYCRACGAPLYRRLMVCPRCLGYRTITPLVGARTDISYRDGMEQLSARALGADHG